MQRITCQEFQALSSPYILLDVRTALEFEDGSIPGAIHIPLSLLPVLAEERLTDKTTKIIVSCQSGGRSAAACDILEGLGYSDISNLEGGYGEYCQQSTPA